MSATHSCYEVYADSFAAESTRAAYPVDVALTVRRQVVVDHQRHLFKNSSHNTRSRLRDENKDNRVASNNGQQASIDTC